MSGANLFCSSQVAVAIFKIGKSLVTHSFKLPENLAGSSSLHLKATISILEQVKTQNHHSLRKWVLLGLTVKAMMDGQQDAAPHTHLFSSSNSLDRAWTSPQQGHCDWAWASAGSAPFLDTALPSPLLPSCHHVTSLRNSEFYTTTNWRWCSNSL